MLNSLLDVLEDLPAAKPTVKTLRVQLTGPGLLIAKSSYDLLAALWDIGVHGLSIKSTIALLTSIVLISIGCLVWGAIRNSYDEALTRKNRHFDRVINWVKWERREHGLDGREGPPPALSSPPPLYDPSSGSLLSPKKP